MISNSTKTIPWKSGLRLLPYAALGILVFAWNSQNDFNYFFKGYLALLECQAGIVVIYFLMTRLARKNKRNQT